MFRHLLLLGVGLLLTLPASADSLPDDPEDVKPLAVGSQAPALKLLGADGEPFDLAQILGHKAAVLIFYRGGW